MSWNKSKQIPQRRTSGFTAAILGIAILQMLSATILAAGDSATTVEAETLKAIAIYPQYKAPATVIALNDSQLSAEVNAVVESIAVEVGQVVKKGDLLVS